MAYVYRHIRLDKNEPFYIGIGSDENYNRAKTNTRRNKHWLNISKFGFEVDILLDNLTWHEACEKEKEFIALYGRSDLGNGVLCNLTNGGDGVLGRIFKHSEDSKLKMSKTRKGIRQYVASLETRQKMSDNAKKRGMSQEHLKKMIEGKRKVGWQGYRKGIPHTEETRKKMSENRKGEKKSEEWCKAQSERVKLYWLNKKNKNNDSTNDRAD
jgi:hypothetical protein